MYRFDPMAIRDRLLPGEGPGASSRACAGENPGGSPREGFRETRSPHACEKEGPHPPSPGRASSRGAHGAAGLSTTADYHRFTPIDLMSEFTICESFSDPASPYGIILEKPSSYGAMVGHFLARMGLLKDRSALCEVGGGYGSLMHGLLSSHGTRVERACMIDLSLSLLKKQRDRLSPWGPRITFIRGDIHELLGAVSGIDLFIVNEIMGDLDTLTGIDPSHMPPEADELVRAYALDIPEKPFNLNIGALRLVEAFCRAGIPALLTEHSCDPVIPDGMAYLARDLDLDAYPREIRLLRHSEYTIRFSHLVRVARAHGRMVGTGALLDLIPVKKGRSLETIFRLRACDTQDHEIIYELLDHIREYRWLTIS